MKRTIIDAIKKAGLDVTSFIIGEGAKSKYSSIHFNPYNDYSNDSDKKYSVQFCSYNDVVAIWEIATRIRLIASINLSICNYNWNDVDCLIRQSKKIQNTNINTEAAVMPIYEFEAYLRTITKEAECDSEYTDNYFDCIEGEKYRVFTNKYERNPRLRRQAIEIHGTKCMVCGFSFEEKYGKIGKDYIEVHHIKPLSEGEQYVDPKTDLVCLCSNCHKMIHRKRDRVLSISDLSKMINNNYEEEP